MHHRAVRKFNLLQSGLQMQPCENLNLNLKSKFKINTVIKSYKLLMGLPLLWNVLGKFAIHCQVAKLYIYFIKKSEEF